LLDSDNEDESQEDDMADFSRMVGDIVSIGRTQGDTTDNLLMEIKSLKFAHNKEFSDCIEGVVPSLLRITVEQAETIKVGSASVKLMNAFKAVLGKNGWGYAILKPLLQEPEDGLALIE